MTRCGQDTKIMFCGDSNQSDLQKINEKTGILDFQKIVSSMTDDFAMIEYGIEDIVRSGLVKNYLIAKLNLGF